MKYTFYIALLAAGLAVGWIVNDHLNDEPDIEPVYMSFEEATKQSKFNLVRDNYAELFNIGEKKTFGSWTALMVVGYTFQYGIDMDDLTLRRVSDDGIQPEIWEVDVKSLELGSAELQSMKSFATDKTIFNKYKEKIQKSQEELIARKTALGLQRLYGDPSKKIYTLLQQSIQETLTNIARGMERDIQIAKVSMPTPPKNWKDGLKFKMKYQQGNINPVFDNRLKAAPGPNKTAEPLVPLETFIISAE